jgi:hypothetical protein
MLTNEDKQNKQREREGEYRGVNPKPESEEKSGN